MSQAPAKDIEAAFQQGGEFELKFLHFVSSCFVILFISGCEKVCEKVNIIGTEIKF